MVSSPEPAAPPWPRGRARARPAPGKPGAARPGTPWLATSHPPQAHQALHYDDTGFEQPLGDCKDAFAVEDLAGAVSELFDVFREGALTHGDIIGVSDGGH